MILKEGAYMNDIRKKTQEHISGTYARFDVVLTEGNGAVCFDEKGKQYVDFTSGIGVNALGFADSDWAAAVSSQASKLQHISNLYYTAPAADLAETLCRLTGCANVFFSNSGAEANEGAIKAARKYSFDKYKNRRSTIITLDGSFHGRTVTTLSATGQDVFHNYFFPFTEGFRFVPPNNTAAFYAAVDETVCAVMLEFVQGEGGVNPLEPEYVNAVYQFCRDNDILLIADEVQTGVGRTGTFLASEGYGVRADITTLAKGLGGGLPIGAVLFGERMKDVLGAGTHGTTYGGNPVACAGANVCVAKISDPGFLDAVKNKGAYIRQALSGCSEVAGIDGVGLMLGIRLSSKSAGEVAKECLAEGLLVLTAKDKVRLLPPLNIQTEELEQGIGILKRVLERK